MAFRGGNGTFSTSLVTSLTITHGISIQAGDVVFLCASANASGVAAPTFPAGFSATLGGTTLGSLAIPTNGEGPCTGFLQAKIAGASEPSSYTITTSSHRWTLVIRVYSGRSGTPYAVAPVTTTPVANHNVPVSLALSTITAHAGDDVCAFIVGSQQEGGATDTTLTTAPTGFANVRNDTGTTANTFTPMIWSCDNTNVTAGTTGSGGTLTGTGGNNTAYGAYVISMAAPYVLVQKVTGGGTTNATSFPLSITGVTPGNFLTAQMTCSVVGGTSQTFALPSDAAGTWGVGALPSKVLPAGIAFLNNAAAGTHALTFALASGATMASYHFTICEWSGLPANAVLDVSNVASATTAQQLSVSITPSQSNDLVLAAVVVGGDPGVTTLGITDPPAGFTSLQVGNNDATDIGFEHCYQVAGTASLTPSWSWTDASTTVSTAVIAGFNSPVLGAQTVNVQTGGLSAAALNYGLTNQSATSSAGTITPEVDITVGSLTATFFEGSLLNQINLTGQTASFTEGTITTAISGNVILALSGQSMGFAQGTPNLVISYLLDQDTITLVGQTATFAMGVLQPNVIALLAAQTLASTEGTISPAPAYTLGALTLTSLEGSITSSLGNNTNLSLIGQNITSSQGAMQFLPGATFPSNTITFTEGTISFSATGDFTVSLIGQTINSSEGTITFTGSAPGFLTMPNVVGIGWLHASHILEKAGLFQTQPPVRVLSKVYPTYTVLGQEPPAGSLIPINSAVQLTVSIDAPLLGASFDVISLF